MSSQRRLKRIVSEEWHNIFLLVLLAVSLGVNVVLFRELRASSPESGVVSKGDRLDPLTVRDMDGTLRNLRFDDVSTPTLWGLPRRSDLQQRDVDERLLGMMK